MEPPGCSLDGRVADSSGPRSREKSPEETPASPSDRVPHLAALTPSLVACQHPHRMRSADSRADAPTGEPTHGDLERRLAAHAPALRAAAAGLCRRGATAELEDLIQDTFERALRHLS